MIYEHIDGVAVTAQFSWENDMRYRYRLEILLKDAAPTGKTVCVVMQNPSYARRGRGRQVGPIYGEGGVHERAAGI